MSLGPFDLTGGPFLTLYGVLFVATIIAGFVIPRWLRPEGRPSPVSDADRLAYLAGGATRFGEALVARLLATGAMVMDGRTKLAIRNHGNGRTSAERSVLALPSPAKWSDVTRTIALDAKAIDDKLVAAGLLIDQATRWQMRFWQTSPYIALIAFGAIKWEVGTLRERPVGYLTALLVVTAILGLIRFCTLDRRTRWGVDTLDAMRRQSDRLRRAPTPEETGLAVALFGTTVLAGSALAPFHQLRNDSGSGSSGDGGSSDGGCGGGGCGGCGG